MEELNLISTYKKRQYPKVIFLAILILIVAIISIIHLSIGSSNMTFIEAISALFGFGNSTNVTIIQNIRLPRLITALLCGFGLAISGYIMQGILKNPMASPSTLGVSNGAVFGANLSIIVFNTGSITTSQGVGINVTNPYLTTFCALIFSLLAMGIILLISSKNKFSSETVVLSGVAIGSLFTALTTIIQYFATDNELSSAIYWSFGDLSNTNTTQNIILAVVIFTSFIYFIISRWSYIAIQSGDMVAKSIGIKTNLIKFIGLFLASLISAVCVSFVGIIGFIGLVAPHIVSFIIGKDYKFSLPCTALTGSALIIFADTLSKVFINGVNFPVGAITSILGAPLLVVLLLRRKGGN